MAMSVYMPAWGRSLSQKQIRELVAYIRTFSDERARRRMLEREKVVVARQQERLVGKENCRICHVRGGDSRAVAPDLGYEGSKKEPYWIFRFLKGPERIRPVGFIPFTKTKMPDFQFKDEEAAAITMYLVQRSESLSEAAVRSEIGEMEMSEDEIRKGKRLFEEKYGCIACHRAEGQGGILGPDLDKSVEGLKPHWSFLWIKNPQALRPDSPMPNIGIPDDRIKLLVAYLMSLKERRTPADPLKPLPPLTEKDEAVLARGEKLVKENNCVACHSLSRFDRQRRVAGLPPQGQGSR